MIESTSATRLGTSDWRYSRVNAIIPPAKTVRAREANLVPPRHRPSSGSSTPSGARRSIPAPMVRAASAGPRSMSARMVANGSTLAGETQSTSSGRSASQAMTTT